MRRSAVRFATLTSEDSGFTLSFSRYSYVFVLIEFYIKFEPKVSSIFFFSKTSREKSRLFSFSFLFLRRFFPYVSGHGGERSHFEEIKFLTCKHQDLRRILLFFQRRRFRNLVFFNGKRERERESVYSLVHVRFKRFSFRLNGRL